MKEWWVYIVLGIAALALLVCAEGCNAHQKAVLAHDEQVLISDAKKLKDYYEAVKSRFQGCDSSAKTDTVNALNAAVHEDLGQFLFDLIGAAPCDVYAVTGIHLLDAEGQEAQILRGALSIAVKNLALPNH